jgi:predicted nucleotidyltransferase
MLLRLPTHLHRELTRSAAARGVSLNEYCVRRLRAPAMPQDTSPLTAMVVARARTVFGTRLAGVLLLGSWARGDAATSSDIDVLIVVDRSVPLTRDLYRVWDREPLTFEGRAIDVHIVHSPSSGAAPTALWCEAAVDGLVWYDRDASVARHLAETRRAIADGRVVRAVVHGQPYWKGAA